ncbi:MAG TPA: hypothetical protein VN380_25595 [Thermoanaerobaculia bacterium]|jgi:hypothetical protein|nr:hypothetical protein [Thermoanaerobaculia bacterium]
MRISRKFRLDATQYQLDFVDIDSRRDLPVFLDPYFLSVQTDQWSFEATRTIRSFFEHFVRLVRADDLAGARELFSYLGEPNETCLGLSKGPPEGRGIGPVNADDMFESLLKSKAIQTGAVEHLEDARIFVDGIGRDKTSDMTTNIIRRHLLEYTRQQAVLWGIPLQAGVPSGDYWSSKERRWMADFTDRLIVSGKPLLLVPKAVVSADDRYTPQQYHSHHVLEYLKNEHMSMNSALVQRYRRKDGTERAFVTKKDLEEQVAPLSKAYLLKFTQDHPEIFGEFREQIRSKMQRMVNENLTFDPLPVVTEQLITRLRAIPSGGERATEYHRTVAGILELIFYPDLFAPQLEHEIHEGRKRIDLTLDNGARDGFFHRLHSVLKIPCAYILVECKNYSRDVANPELDQMSGRFSPNRGKFGIVVSRTVDDMPLLLARCADSHRDDRGTILPLADADLITILEALGAGAVRPEQELLQDRLRAIVLV